MRIFLDRYFRLLQHLLTAFLVVLLVPVLLQVLSRLVPFIPRYIWTEELARFAFVWIILIGSSVAVRDQGHFFVDILPSLPKRYEHLIRLVGYSCMFFLAIIFIWEGYAFTQFGFTQQSEIASLPMWTIYIAWPLAGMSWMLFLIEKVYDEFLNPANT